MCMTPAPALKAAFASRAISSGVTGTLCCFGSVSTPFSAQVMTALSLMEDFQVQGLQIQAFGQSSQLCVGLTPASCVHPLACGLYPCAAVDREVARAGK